MEKKFTKKDFEQFKELFMMSVHRLGLTEWAYSFKQIDDDEDIAADIRGDLCQKTMLVRLSKTYKAEEDKYKLLLDSAEHEAIETLLYHLRMKAAHGMGDAAWVWTDGHCHTIINRIQSMIFPIGWERK